LYVCGAGCPVNDAVCERDWIGFEAIAQLHSQIDDDHNGSLDRLESDEVNMLNVFLVGHFASVIVNSYYTFDKGCFC